jgi:hypothetical protein
MPPADETYYRRLAGSAGVPFVSLKHDPPDPFASRVLARASSRYFGIVVLGADAESITIAAWDPEPVQALAAVESATGRTARVVVASREEIEEWQRAL